MKLWHGYHSFLFVYKLNYKIIVELKLEQNETKTKRSNFCFVPFFMIIFPWNTMFQVLNQQMCYFAFVISVIE